MDGSTQAGGHLVRLERAGVSRGGAELLAPTDFRLEPGARWAVLGPNGAGKTTFLRLVRGDIPPDAAADTGSLRVYDLPGAGGPQPTPLGLRQRLALVAGEMQDAFAANDWAATGLEAVLAGFSDSALLYAEPAARQRERAAALLQELGLSGLGRRRMARLSTGEARKLLLARALVVEPDVLLLDECLEGLDAASRREFLALLDRVAALRPGLAVLFSSHRQDELPACLTRGLVLRRGRVEFAGELARALVLYAETSAQEAVPTAPTVCASAAERAPKQGPEDFLVRITGADVALDGRRILEGVAWTIRPREHWVVLGPNGAGKSTLLSLLAGELWPTALFGPPGRVEYGFAGPDAPLDEVRRRIGVVSPALQAAFPYDLRVEEAVAAGLSAGLDLYAPPDEAGWARVAALLARFGLAGLAARRVRGLSRGQFRRVLLARALACGPALLVLDEPLSGLDRAARREVRALLNQVAEQGTALVMVTHHASDLPACMNRALELAEGRVMSRGEWRGAAKEKAARTERTA